MPCIQTITNVKIPKEKEETIKVKFGKAIELIPGKSENWLMVTFQDECSMYFKGSARDVMALVEVKLFGKASSKAYDSLTETITSILQAELGIEPPQIYVKYEEVEHWGFNGRNF